MQWRSAQPNGPERPTVSAVSLTANEFPGGGLVAEFACVSVLMGVVRVANIAWEKKHTKKQLPGCSGKPCTPGFRATQQDELLSQRCYSCLCPCQTGLPHPAAL